MGAGGAVHPRTAVRPVTIAGVEIPAGAHGHRCPRFGQPRRDPLRRPRPLRHPPREQQHLAFARARTCASACTWPAWRCASSWRRCSTASPTSSSTPARRHRHRHAPHARASGSARPTACRCASHPRSDASGWRAGAPCSAVGVIAGGLVGWLLASATAKTTACSPGDRPEPGVQGQVPLVDELTNASQQGYSCNLRVVGSNDLGGRGGDWQLAWYGECAVPLDTHTERRTRLPSLTSATRSTRR